MDSIPQSLTLQGLGGFINGLHREHGVMIGTLIIADTEVRNVDLAGLASLLKAFALPRAKLSELSGWVEDTDLTLHCRVDASSEVLRISLSSGEVEVAAVEATSSGLLRDHAMILTVL